MQADRVEKTFGQVLCTERERVTESESENELDISSFDRFQLKTIAYSLLEIHSTEASSFSHIFIF